MVKLHMHGLVCVSNTNGIDENRWSEHLPDDLIEMLVKRLSLVDSLKFSAVCTSWRRISSQWFQRATRIPWILKQIQSVDSTTANCSLYSPSEDCVYNLKFPKATTDTSYYMSFLGAIDGHLIMSEHKWLKTMPLARSINYLLNPITGARIMLPPLSEVPMISVASSNPRCSECIVATILTPHTHKLAFCRPGDKSWTYQSGPKYGIHFQDLQFHKDGKLYAWAYKRGIIFLVVFDPLEVFSEAKSQIYKGKEFEIGRLIERHEKLYGINSKTCPFFMLSLRGDILIIWDQYTRKLNVAPFLVFKLDLSPEPELIKTTLEDQTVLISLNKQFKCIVNYISIPLSRLTNSTSKVLNDKAFNELGGGNCIYLAKNTTGHYVICIYNLADGRIDYLSAENYVDGNNDVPRLINGYSWFTPEL